jgi:SAM-dependent methyltransferase
MTALSDSARLSGWHDYPAASWQQRKPLTWLDDWPFWKWCAEEYAGKSPILELACGNGRITRQLALQGYEVVAVDINPHFLNRAHQTLDEENKELAQFVLQDMVRLDLEANGIEHIFELAIMADWAFPALLTVDDQASFFHHLNQHLAPGGIFAFDTPFPTVRQQGLQPTPNGEELEWPGTGRRYDPVSQIETRPSGDQTLRLRHTTLGEIVLLGKLTGFEIMAQFGGTDKRPLRGLPGDSLTLLLRKTS